ncbi:LLM class flavin-dependent oxidoreductase [Kaistia dalseonensis]|uniref:FMN-dependent oxidoreductase (Nitrilotriacetate monooxygenase family) n=1 Tax=Kaistia dalseonensis TaxID=410840 RepID=A0ABU0HAM6_9HYPH|nr:LLM class flavin-dependent oxidoreductase [Kaistia dalseonensis]MCX5496695.1 LLM class flavin-dependent oxidoreductase [Kaistia dalseonensis]MDQ0439320.1 FMN-dependent oxidoreductase (nitrilotriacetate monooxygenase family) [Kaistia dalseonensis]
MKRQIHFGLFIMGTGSHIAGWRYPGAFDSFQNFDQIKEIGAAAERGKFDLIFMGDNLYADPAAHPSYTLRLEPLTMLAALSQSTSHIGLGATASTTYGDPFSTARAFASLDHISKGRAAWNAVTTANAVTAANFGRDHPDHSQRYAIAEEFVGVVRGLWDCWDDDALVANRETGLYIDPAKVRPLNHEGAFFQVKGPVNIGRSPQGQPVILQAGGSAPGQRLAARTADVIFSVVQDFDEAAKQYAGFKAQLAQFGRRPEDVTVLPGFMPVVGRTEREAFDKLATLQGFVSTTNALTMLSERFGTDMSAYDLDGPVPDIQFPDTYHSFTSVMIAKARRENLTLRDIYNLTAAARGHWVLCGSAEMIADTLQYWFENGAADGFNVMPPYFPDGFNDFVDLVVPILQERGLFRTEYEGTTLRDHLGLTRPAVGEWAG